MRKRIHLAPFALTSDGHLILNAAALDGQILPDALLERALQQRGRLFVGIELSAVEVSAAMKRTRDGIFETAAYAVGARQRRVRRVRPR